MRISKVKFWFRFFIKLILGALFLYLWDYWATLLLFFRDTNIVFISDYIITLPFNIVLVLSFFRMHMLLKGLCLILIGITTCVYGSILLFGQAHLFAVIGLGGNFFSAILMLYPLEKECYVKNDYPKT